MSLTAAVEVADTHERLKEPVDETQFAEAWRKYAAAHSEQHILVDAMTKATPEKTGDEEYKVIVQHPAQLQAFELAMPKILEFLRSELHNDFLAVRAEIDTSVQNSPKMLPPQEFIRRAISANPTLGEFLKSIDAELA